MVEKSPHISERKVVKEMIERKLKSTLPVYAAGIAFVVFSLIFTIYAPFSLLLALFCSFGVGFIVSKFAPIKTVMVEVPPEPASTSDVQLNQLIDEGRAKLVEIGRLSGKIEDPQVFENVCLIKGYGDKIFNQLEAHPEKIRSVRLFMDYYLPTSYNLIESYVGFKSQGAEGENISRAAQKIESALCMAAESFKKQFDNMFEAKATDIIAEANVMKRLLQSGGLTGNDFDASAPGKEGFDAE